jgi:diguanylate cyclase (GGDEF)-like protein
VLKAVADLIRINVREYDIVARWGGEEILIMLKKTNALQGQIVGDKIRTIIATNPFQYNGNRFSVTVTIGVA